MIAFNVVKGKCQIKIWINVLYILIFTKDAIFNQYKIITGLTGDINSWFIPIKFDKKTIIA